MKQLNVFLIASIIFLSCCEASKPVSDDTQQMLVDNSSVEDKSISEKNEVADKHSESTADQSNSLKNSNDDVQSQKESSDVGPWDITTQSDFSEEEQVKITFTNQTDSDLIVFNPLRKSIERLINESWEPVEIVYCQCRPCPAPPETKEIAPGKYYAVRWSKKEDSCKNGQFSQQDCTTGTYRVIVEFVQNGKRSTEVVEFTI